MSLVEYVIWIHYTISLQLILLLRIFVFLQNLINRTFTDPLILLRFEGYHMYRSFHGTIYV